MPLVLYLGIASARARSMSRNSSSRAGACPVYNGAVLSAVLIGGTGFFGYTGALFFLGFDALAIGLAWTTGLIVSRDAVRALLEEVRRLHAARLFRPPLPLALHVRLASVLQLPPVALLLAAEIKVAALIAAMFLPLSYTLAVATVVVIIAAITIAGGMRSLTWSASAAFIVGRDRLRRASDHRRGDAHQSAGAAAHLWRDVRAAPTLRDHRRHRTVGSGRTRHRARHRAASSRARSPSYRPSAPSSGLIS